MFMLDLFIENEYLQSLFVIVITIISIILCYLILKLVFMRFGKDKKYVKYAFKRISKPIVLLIFIAGLYTALKSISFLSAYHVNIGESDHVFLDITFFIALAFTFSFLISRIINVSMFGLAKSKRRFDRPPGLINKLITFIIYIIAIFVILSYYQLDITPMIAGVGLGALAIGLALQSTLSNFFAGVHLLSDKPINVGDFIELDEKTTGVVEDIGWRSTRIKMLTDNLLIIPNGKLAESNIINYSLPKQDLSVWVPCGVSYESDLEHVEKVTLEVLKEIQQSVDGAVKDFEPVFRYREFGDSNINFIAVLRVSDPMKRFVVRNEFIKALKKRFDKENIEISWPIVKIYNVKQK
jgi:small-conductance mechanosensitive channel